MVWNLYSDGRRVNFFQAHYSIGSSKVQGTIGSTVARKKIRRERVDAD